jgi:hypothetical protein
MLMPLAKQQYFDAAGAPLAGGKVYTYATGTNNPKATFTDAAGTTAQTNPIILNVRGEPDNPIFWSGDYRVEVRDAQDSVIYVVDNYDTDPAGIWAVRDAGGASLVGYLQQDGVGATNLQAALRAELANVNLFFIPGESDHTGMFNRASAAARRVYVPQGSYTVNAANWPSNTEFFGDGDNSVINVVADANYAFTCDSGSPDVANNIVNLRMTNLQLRATCDINGFSEFKHLVSINGVSNVVFEHVLFKGFRGDGLYVGSSNTSGLERHNQNITVKRCRFDGINRENRNGISFVDVDFALVEGCTFTNCSRPEQPGPIDCEPDARPWGIIRNVTVRGNKFVANGGGVGEISVYVPAAVVAPPQNITVEHNTSTGYVGSGQFFYFADSRAPTATSIEHDIKLLFNDVRNANIAFGIFTGKRVLIHGNTFIDMAADAKIGYTEATTFVRDVSVVENRFVRCGSTSGTAIFVFQADYLAFSSNKFIDCGSGKPGKANAIDFNTGASSYVWFDDNEFSAPTGKTQVAIQREAKHVFNIPTNRYLRNIDAGLTNAFQAEESDSNALEQSYLPVVSGSNTNSGTSPSGYATQYGRWRRVGKTVFFRFKVSVGPGFTGTGMIQVGLPTAAQGTPNNEEYPVTLAVDGAATSGTQIGLINPALVISGLGAVRCYYTGTGSLAQTLVPAGAFTVYASGTYQCP